MSNCTSTLLNQGMRGMTLIEVLVALVIIAVALAAAIRSTNAGVANTDYLKQRSIAHWVAMNESVELELTGDLVEGESTQDRSMAGYDWQVQTRIRATSDRDVLRGEISVAAEDDPESILSTVEIYVGRPL